MEAWESNRQCRCGHQLSVHVTERRRTRCGVRDCTCRSYWAAWAGRKPMIDREALVAALQIIAVVALLALVVVAVWVVAVLVKRWTGT